MDFSVGSKPLRPDAECSISAIKAALEKVVFVNYNIYYCPVVNLKSSRWPKYTQLGSIFRQKIMFYYQTFFPLQMCSSLDYS